MTAVKFSPIGNGTNWIPGSGLIANGYKLFFYAAGTTTKQDTYTTYAGAVANSNPITLNAYGRSANEIWLVEGQSYKVVIASGTDTDPPSSGVTLGDYITGINDSGDLGQDQWVLYGSAPTYISGTSFSVTGDQTTTFHVGRRLKTVNTGGTIYSTITASVYGALTTITVVNDSSTLDAGLSAVSYGILSSSNPSVPKILLPDGSTAVTQAQSDVTTKIATNAYAALMKHNAVNDFRLTLTSATPVTTSDVTGATTVYMTPFVGNKIGLYNGTTWDLITTAEISVALGTITSDQGYDVFCYNNSGTATLELTAWTNNTTRATALVMQDGILCKTGALTRRYLGSFLTTSTTQTEDSEAKRYLFNYYNRINRSLRAVDGTASWTYSSATIRQANASSVNQLNLFLGVVDQKIRTSQVTNVLGGNPANVAAGIGLNTTTAFTGTYSYAYVPLNGGTCLTSVDNYSCTLGKNYLARLEQDINAAVTVTWYGTGSSISADMLS